MNLYIFNRFFKSVIGPNAWIKQNLNEVTDIFDGTHQTPKYRDSGIPFYSVENIKSLKTDKFISNENFFNEFKKFPEFGDVFLTRIGDVGTSNVYNKNYPAAYYVSLALLKSKKIDSYYLHSLLDSNDVQREIWKRTLHVAFPKKINKNEIGKISITMSDNEEEQKQIGKLLNDVDIKIGIVKNKVKNLNQLKKYLMQNLFI